MMSTGEREVLKHRLTRGPSVVFSEKSHNRKLSPVVSTPKKQGQKPDIRAVRPFVCSTFASIDKTCPASCELKRTPEGPRGCFADAGLTRMRGIRLDKAARDLEPEQVIAEEAREIDRAFRGGRVPQDGQEGGRDLRVHVGGDVPSRAAALTLGAAATRWRARGGGRVWSYTHNWRQVPRAAWGPDVHALASVDRLEDLEDARRQGYAPAIVVESFKSPKAFRLGRFRVVPCPAETRGSTCASCRLCLGGVDLHGLRIVIAFEAHGQHREEALVQLRLKDAPLPERVAKKPYKRPLRTVTCGRCNAPGHNSRTCTGTSFKNRAESTETDMRTRSIISPILTQNSGQVAESARRRIPQNAPETGRNRYVCGVCGELGHNARRHRSAA